MIRLIIFLEQEGRGM